MARPSETVPPRPIAPGDVVAAFSMHLGEWTAAQVIHLNHDWQQAGVLDLDWSGPEPASVADLGDVRPLRLTHHRWAGVLSYFNYEWILPRSYKVIGTLPLLHDQPSNSYSAGWPIGDQLALQRRWDRAEHAKPARPWKAEYTGSEIDQLFDEETTPRPEIKELSVSDITALDCGRLVERFPGLTRLYLRGDLGLLSSAERLNELVSLQRIHITDLFGMSKQDHLVPQRVPRIEALCLNGIPAEYATVTRSAWRREIPNGTHLVVSGARKPGWIAENRDNPLRDWDGRSNISQAQFKKAVAQYKTTRRAILAALADRSGRPERLVEIGREYGEAFNKLDRGTGFIETVEREELFAALEHVVAEAETSLGRNLTWAGESLASGLDSVRDW